MGWTVFRQAGIESSERLSCSLLGVDVRKVNAITLFVFTRHSSVVRRHRRTFVVVNDCFLCLSVFCGCVDCCCSYIAITHYLTTMLTSMDRVKCWLKGIESDQGYQNYLFYTGYFNVPGLGDAVAHPQGVGVVNTIGAMNGFRFVNACYVLLWLAVVVIIVAVVVAAAVVVFVVVIIVVVVVIVVFDGIVCII